MPGNAEVPDLPEDLSTTKQFGRFLALRMRGDRIQAAVANATEKLARSGSPDAPVRLTTQRISKMENPDGALPSAAELRSYLIGCGKAEWYPRLEPVRLRLQRELFEADLARESAGPPNARVVAGMEAARSSASGPVPMTTPTPVALAGLPAEEGFSGRGDILESLAEVLRPTVTDDADVPVITMVSGLAGVGKTSVVLRAAHRAVAAGWFDGALFVNLHGYDPADTAEPQAALAALLSALGVPGERIPPTRGEREALYRSQLGAMAAEGHRVLIFADNASDLDQVLALRPGGTVHRMVVTGRDTLPVHGARRIELEVLPEDEALAVVAMALRMARPQDERVAAEPAAAAALVRLCDYLPLALRITAELLADRPWQPIGDLVDLLTATQDRLGELAYGDSVGIRLAFEASYRRLPAPQAQMFCLAALHPGQFFELDALAAVTGEPLDVTRRSAEGLRRAHLFQPTVALSGYRFHDLVRLFAREKCATDRARSEQKSARGRLLDHYRDTAVEAGRLFDPRRAQDQPSRFLDEAAAGAWLELERPNLVAVINMAASLGYDEHAVDTGLALRFFFNRRKFWDDWIATGVCTVEAAKRVGDESRLRMAFNMLGVAYLETRRLDEALICFEDVLTRSRSLGDRQSEAMGVINIGNVHHEQGRAQEAISWYRKAVPILRELEDFYGLGQALNNLAFVFAGQGMSDNAIDHYEQALDQFRIAKDPTAAAVAMTNLGAVYQKLGRWEEALIHHRQALAVFERSDDRLHEGRTLRNLGLTYSGMNRSQDALSCYQTALKIFVELNADPDIDMTRIQIAKLTGI